MASVGKTIETRRSRRRWKRPYGRFIDARRFGLLAAIGSLVLRTALATAGVIGLAWVVLVPPTRPELSRQAAVRTPSKPTSRDVSIPPLSEFAKVWDARLRQEGVHTAERPRKSQRPTRPAVPRPDVKLLGVYGGQIAVFRAPSSGQRQVAVGVGERVGDAVVKQVTANAVELERRGTRFRFELGASNRR